MSPKGGVPVQALGFGHPGFFEIAGSTYLGFEVVRESNKRCVLQHGPFKERVQSESIMYGTPAPSVRVISVVRLHGFGLATMEVLGIDFTREKLLQTCVSECFLQSIGYCVS